MRSPWWAIGIYTDVAMARNAGALGVLVLSGETTEEVASRLRPQPTSRRCRSKSSENFSKRRTGNRIFRLPFRTKVAFLKRDAIFFYKHTYIYTWFFIIFALRTNLIKKIYAYETK